MLESKEKKIAAGLSITSNAVIIVLKVIAGIISGSISIISEAVHSFTDFLASILTFYAVSRSSEPADKEHPYGHGKYEDMSGFIEGGLIILAGGYIIYEAFLKLISYFDGNNNINTEIMTIGIWVMAFAVVLNFIVSSYLFYVAKKTDSISLYADAQHLRIDIYSSSGILIGLVVIRLTGIIILDPIIAIIVAAVIVRTGYSISKETLNNLLDVSLPAEDIGKIEQILNKTPDIKGYKNLKARKTGQNREIDITVFFNPDLKISQCHKICDDIEEKISMVFNNAVITIHPEPKSGQEEKQKVF